MTDDTEWLAAAFEQHRDHLRAVAYRLLGSMSDAEDAVQDTWLRLTGADTHEVENLGGWLTTVVARVSLNMLRSRAVRREEPLSPRLPDPIIDRADGVDPEHEALLADSVGLAHRAQHPVGDRPQAAPVLLEQLRKPVLLAHRSHILPRKGIHRLAMAVIGEDPPGPADVTPAAKRPARHIPGR